MSKLSAFVGCPTKAAEILKILDLDIKEPIKEYSGLGAAAASGAIEGYAGPPFGPSSSVKKSKRKKKKKKKNESVDLSIADEVFKLLNERGIIT